MYTHLEHILSVFNIESESLSVVSNSLQPHGLYSPWGRKESDMTERLTLYTLNNYTE